MQRFSAIFFLSAAGRVFSGVGWQTASWSVVAAWHHAPASLTDFSWRFPGRIFRDVLSVRVVKSNLQNKLGEEEAQNVVSALPCPCCSRFSLLD